MKANAVRLWASSCLLIAFQFSALPAHAQGIVLGAPASTEGGICPASDALPPPDKRPWLKTDRLSYGPAFAQAMDDMATGLAAYDEKALERALAYFRTSNAIGAKTNAAGTLRRLADTRHDAALLDEAIAFAAAEYTQLGSRGKDEYYQSAVISARLNEIYALRSKAGAADSAEALTLLQRAEALARSAATQFPTNPGDPYGPPPFALAAATALASQGALRDDLTTINRAIDERRAILAALSGSDRIETGSEFASLIVHSAKLAPDVQRTAILREGRTMAETLLGEAAANRASAKVTEAASRLNETAAGQWRVQSNGERTRCLQTAKLRAVMALADLELSTDDAALEDARRRLEAADSQFSAVPLFEHTPYYQYALAQSFVRQLNNAAPRDAAMLRERGTKALREARRLRAACFCNQLDSGLTEIEGSLSNAAAPVTTP